MNLLSDAMVIFQIFPLILIQILTKYYSYLLSAALLIPHPAQITMAGFWYNMTAVTLGNIVGGAFFVGLAYWFVSKRKSIN